MFTAPVTHLGTFLTSIPGFKTGDFDGMYSRLAGTKTDIELNNLVASMANSLEDISIDDYEFNSDLCMKNKSLDIYDQVCKGPMQRDVLGDKFDLKQFHEQFLSYGSAPVRMIKGFMEKN